MSTVFEFPKRAAGSHRLLATLPDERSPLVLTIPPHLARSIRQAAGWAGNSPEQQALQFLETGFGPRSMNDG